MKDRLISCIAKKKSVTEMYDAWIPLYQSVNISHKILLKNKLMAIDLNDTNTIYPIKISELGDQLAAT